MSLLTTVIRSLLPTTPASVPASAPISTASAAEPIQQPQRRVTAPEDPKSLDVIYETILRRSPLAAAPTPAAADTLDVIYRDDLVQRAAGACAAKLQHLAEMAGFNSQIHAAIETVTRDGTDLTQSAVIEALRHRAEDIENALADIREDRAAHQAAGLERMARHEPLRSAVRRLLTELVSERNGLIRADEAAARAATLGLPTRFGMLRNLGMTEAQIEATEPTAANPEILTQRRHARFVEITPQIEKLRAFAASPIFDAALLADFPDFSDLIRARDGEKVAA